MSDLLQIVQIVSSLSGGLAAIRINDLSDGEPLLSGTLS
ncbi:hypothetical protein FMEAI12_5290015 [Parafrankia sp. Ea1.12]|nr:hypothetical protein FMEAI12_5290015 [Parafrankia sp. Ea1.12]